MQIDKNMIKNALNLNDEDLKRTLTETAKAGGIDPAKFSNALKDMQNLKKTITGLSDKDIANMVNSFGSDKLESLVKNLKNNN